MKKECAKENINKFKLKKEEKEKLLFINDYLHKCNQSKSNYNLVITIDNMPLKDKNRYVDYITKVVECNGIKNISNGFRQRVNHVKSKSIILFNHDEDDIPWNMKHDTEDFIKLISNFFMNKNIVIITSSIPLDELDIYNNSDLLNIMPHVSFHGEYSESEEYRKLIYKYKHNNIDYEIKLDDFNKIVNSIQDNNYVKNYRISDYLYEYSIINSLNKKGVNIETFDNLLNTEENTDKDNTKDAIDINELVGLDNVKEELKKLFNYVNFIKEHNIDREETYLNMFFLGNPGTGKTMVASIIANKLYELGFIEKNEVVKVIPTDLIGEYVGHTKRKVRDILTKAKGKLLFIDEAYLLYNDSYKGGNNPFMEEAIVELLKYLEDVNNITIFAGYKDEMMKLYQTNPGLKSRIYKEIIFDDYSIDELYHILEKDLNKKGFSIQGIHKQIIEKYINRIKKEKSFGNARSMKQLAQKLIINHANNYANKRTLEELIITKNDIPSEVIENKKEMGFGE